MRKFIFYGDPNECNKIIGEGMVFAKKVEERIDMLSLDYYTEEYYLDAERHIRVEVRRPDNTFVHIYASASSYYMKAGLIRSGKVVAQDGKYMAKDFLPSSVMFQAEHDKWSNSSTKESSPEPKREYRLEGGFSFTNADFVVDAANPIPSRFTGLLHQAVEFAMGAGRKIDLAHGFYKTHGICRVGDTDWLVEIGKDRNVARKITKLDSSLFPQYKTIIDNSKLGYVPKELLIPTGEKYQKEIESGDIIVLSGDFSTRECYQNGWHMDYSNHTGWSFNDAGNSCVNCFMKAWYASSSQWNTARVVKVDISITNANPDTNTIAHGSLTKTEVSKENCDMLYLSGYLGPLFAYAGRDDDDAAAGDMPMTSSVNMWANTGMGFSSFYATKSNGSQAPGDVMAQSTNEFAVWAGYVKNNLHIVKFGYERHEAQGDHPSPTYSNSVPSPAGPIPSFIYGGVSGSATCNDSYTEWDQPAYARRFIKSGGSTVWEWDSGAPIGKSVNYHPGYGGVCGSVQDESFGWIWNDSSRTWGNMGWISFYAAPLSWGNGTLTYTDFAKPDKRSDITMSFAASPTDRCSYVIKKCNEVVGHSDYADAYWGISSLPYIQSSIYREFRFWRDCSCQGPASYDYNARDNTELDGWHPYGSVFDTPQHPSLGHKGVWDAKNKWVHVVITSGTCCNAGAVYTETFGPERSANEILASLYSPYNAIREISPGTYDIGRVKGSPTLILGSGHTTNQVEQNIIKAKDHYFVNGSTYQEDCPDNQQKIEIYIPGYGPFKYPDGLLFLSFRCSNDLSSISFAPNLGVGNSSTGDTKMFLKEIAGDSETFVNWYLDDTVPWWMPRNRYFYPYYNPLGSNAEQNEVVYRQFFGPYVWVGPQ